MGEEKIKPLKEVRWWHIQQVLEATGWNIEQAASILKISRKQLLRELRRGRPGTAPRTNPDFQGAGE